MREDPLYNLVPGYREAVQRETDLRDAAFLPVTDSICGVEVNQLTPFHLAALTLARSPFICGGVPFPRDIALFLWCVSPEYNPRAVVSRWLFIRRVAKLDYREAVEGVMRYVGEAFADAPGGKGERFKQSYYSSTASIVDLLAHEYGWAEADIMRVPFKRLFQYSRCIRERYAERPMFFNSSDSILADWQDEQNQRAKEEALN
jgi:hypothetical protein